MAHRARMVNMEPSGSAEVASRALGLKVTSVMRATTESPATPAKAAAGVEPHSAKSLFAVRNPLAARPADRAARAAAAARAAVVASRGAPASGLRSVQ